MHGILLVRFAWVLIIPVYCFVRLRAFIPTYVENVEYRNIIRNSYGKFSGNWTYSFIIGHPITLEVQREMEKHNDITIANASDGLANHRLKLVHMLSFWNATDYLFKASEGTFVNVPKMLLYLKTMNEVSNNASIFGSSFTFGQRARRSGYNFVPRRAYGNRTLPPLASPTGYLISALAASKMIVQVDELLTTKLALDPFFISILSDKCNNTILDLNTKYTAFANRESMIISPNNWLIAQNMNPDDMVFLFNNLLHKQSLSEPNVTLHWPNIQSSYVPKLSAQSSAAVKDAYKKMAPNGPAYLGNSVNVKNDFATNMTLRLLSFLNKSRVVHNNVLQHTYRERERFNNTWVHEYCPEVIDHFHKVPYFDYYNPNFGGSIALSTVAASSSVCLLHIFSVIAKLVDIPWMIFAGTHLGAVLHGGPM